MADFVAVLKKTIDAQAENTPEMRQRVYSKARSTIEQKLVTANASQAVAVRQRKILEDAITETEAYYSAVDITEEDNLFDPLESFLEETTRSAPAAHAENSKQDAVEGDGPVSDDASVGAVETSADRLSDEKDWGAQREDTHQDSASYSRRSEYDDEDSSGKNRSYKGLIAALIAVLVVGGVGYGLWSNKDEIANFASSLGRSDAPGDATQEGANDTASQQTIPSEETPSTPDEEQKLTQRLMPDGSEVDEGRAGGEATIGEGTSTAPSTPPTTGQTVNPTQSQEGEAVAVGQQALLYEERGGANSGSVERGNVVWSVIEESPNEGEPAEPAIRGTVSMPDSGTELKLTIRRNTDQSIPASHLIEMVFSVPDEFSGGAIDNVQRITFKDTEQAPGNPLIAVPSKIADNFFIIWLNDARTAQDTNLSLMRRLQWIDMPISYRNGRRALISLEKGVPGEKVFNEVLGAK